jgi:hypothetical protein
MSVQLDVRPTRVEGRSRLAVVGATVILGLRRTALSAAERC